jgi:hypothetical protein
MSSAGHILDMIKRMGQNRALRPSNRQKFQAKQRETMYAGANNENKPQFKEIPEAQVEEAILHIRKEAKTTRRKERVVLFIFFGFVAAFVLYVILSSTNYAKNTGNTSLDLEEYIDNAIEWSGRASDPLPIPFSDFHYVPVIGNLNHEVDIMQTYRMSPSDMVVNNTTNILFFDKDCALIGKLLPKNGSVSFMSIVPIATDLGPKRIIYLIAESDSNYNGLIENKDQHFVYMSDVDGKGLIRITEREISRFTYGGKEILMEFNPLENSNDSLYGLYNTETKEMVFTNRLE